MNPPPSLRYTIRLNCQTELSDEKEGKKLSDRALRWPTSSTRRLLKTGMMTETNPMTRSRHRRGSSTPPPRSRRTRRRLAGGHWVHYGTASMSAKGKIRVTCGRCAGLAPVKVRIQCHPASSRSESATDWSFWLYGCVCKVAGTKVSMASHIKNCRKLSADDKTSFLERVDVKTALETTRTIAQIKAVRYRAVPVHNGRIITNKILKELFATSLPPLRTSP